MAQNSPFFNGSTDSNFRDNEVAKLPAAVECTPVVASASDSCIGSPTNVILKTQQSTSLGATVAPAGPGSVMSSSSSGPTEVLSGSSSNSIIFTSSSLPRNCAAVVPSSPKFVSPSLCSRKRMLHKLSTSSAEVKKALLVAQQKNRRRCSSCRIKIPITSISCSCGLIFCAKHRYAEEHDCTYDFKLAAKRRLELENPKVIATKVAKIN